MYEDSSSEEISDDERGCGLSPSEVHSVVFNKNKFNVNQARNWIMKHGFKEDYGIHETKNTYRFRQIPPEEFDAFRVKKLKGGIFFVLGFKDDGTTDLTGEGIFDTIKSAYQGIKYRIQNVGKSRTNIPPKSRAVLERLGNIPISKGYVCRKPLNSILQTIIKKTTSIDYDNLFHLSCNFILTNGIRVRFEKNEVVNVEVERDTSGRECRELGNVQGKTLNEIVEKTRSYMGDEEFHKYRALTNNCQVFVRSIINANDLSFDDSDDFVMQELCGMVKPGISKTANVLTDIANKLNLMIHGKGLASVLDPDMEAGLDRSNWANLSALEKISILDNYIHRD